MTTIACRNNAPMAALCNASYEMDAEDAFNLAFAVRMAKLTLGKELQARGILTQITFHNSDRLHPEYAGEIAAAELNIGQADLSNARAADIEKWCGAYAHGLPLLMRLNAAIAEIKSERELAAIGA